VIRSQATPIPGRIAGWPARLGLAGIALKSCLGLYLSILAGRSRLDMPAFADALRQAGLSMLPAITLVTSIAGLILGNQTAKVLEHFDLPGVVLLTIAYVVVMELVPILVGILVAGRAGVALAVRQATLVVSGEIDGLLVTGINPIQFTLGPALLAMLLMSFAFTIWGSLVTYTAALLWLWGAAGVSPTLFLDALAGTRARRRAGRPGEASGLRAGDRPYRHGQRDPRRVRPGRNQPRRHRHHDRCGDRNPADRSPLHHAPLRPCHWIRYWR